MTIVIKSDFFDFCKGIMFFFYALRKESKSCAGSRTLLKQYFKIARIWRSFAILYSVVPTNITYPSRRTERKPGPVRAFNDNTGYVFSETVVSVLPKTEVKMVQLTDDEFYSLTDAFKALQGYNDDDDGASSTASTCFDLTLFGEHDVVALAAGILDEFEPVEYSFGGLDD